MTTDQQIIKLIRPIFEAAKKIDPRIEEVGLIVNTEAPHEKGVYFNFHGRGVNNQSGYGIHSAADKIKPYDPKAEKLAEIEKLRAELAALETNPETEEK